MFKIGDEVQIVDFGEEYITYPKMVELLELNNFDKEGVSYRKKYKVINKSFHSSLSHTIIYAIEDESGSQHLFGVDGLEKYKQDWSKVKYGTEIEVWDGDNLCPKQHRRFIAYVEGLDYPILTAPLSCPDNHYGCIHFEHGRVL